MPRAGVDKLVRIGTASKNPWIMSACLGTFWALIEELIQLGGIVAVWEGHIVGTRGLSFQPFGR